MKTFLIYGLIVAIMVMALGSYLFSHGKTSAGARLNVCGALMLTIIVLGLMA